MAKKKRAASRKRQSPRPDSPHIPPLQAAPLHAKGSLIIIGGHENKDGQRRILEEVARRVGKGKLVIATLASEEPEAQFDEYRDVFGDIGVKRIVQLDARSREELVDPSPVELLDGAEVIFFGGGDQLKITSRFGGTPLCEVVRQLYARGATIAGTSSGASAMSETMLIAGQGESSHTNGTSSPLRMAPGLGFLPGIIVDQHFAERGRIGRLLGAVAQNPRLLGIGIDEDTAAIFDGHRKLTVIGSGAVYVIDGRNLVYTDIAEETDATTSIHNVMLHVLAAGDGFDLEHRQPIVLPRRQRMAAKQQQRELTKAEQEQAAPSGSAQ